MNKTTAEKNIKTWDDFLNISPDRFGEEIYSIMQSLFPICRSITGEGVRKSHEMIGEHIPLKTTEIPSGKSVFDWTVPLEWNIRDAYIKNEAGEKIIDFKKSNLHVINYSSPIHKKVSFEELKKHLHTLPEQPDAIPYVTSYYEPDWGFCLTHRQFQELKEGEYEVFIDASLEKGSLTYSECVLKGESNQEILISCYTCHPSMCNDNLSGVALTTLLAKYAKELPLKYTYRFLFIPETIGAITWLAENKKNLGKIKCGLVATCVGDPGCLTYKRSRQGNSMIDDIVVHVLQHSGSEFRNLDFFPTGSDERQFCSPGINLAMGSLMRTPYGQFPEYHTSLDDLNFVRAESLGDAFYQYAQVLNVLEHDATYINQNQECEPNLGKRGLYRTKGGKRVVKNTAALYWVLNFSDGNHSLLDIANKANISFSVIQNAANLLCDAGLLRVDTTKMGDSNEKT